MTAAVLPGRRAAVPVAVAQWCLPAAGAEAVALAADLGFSAIQLDLGGGKRGPALYDRHVLDEVAAACAARSVEVLAIAGNVLNDIGLCAAQDSEAGREAAHAIGRCIDVADHLGAPLVFLPSFRRSSIETPADLVRTAEALRRACIRAGARGIRVANENGLDVRHSRRLIDLVGISSFRLILDTYNPVRSGFHVPDIVGALASRLHGQVHLKDGRAGVSGAAALGAGDAGVVNALAAIVASGIATHFVLENDYREDAETRTAEDLGRLRVMLAGARMPDAHLR